MIHTIWPMVAQRRRRAGGRARARALKLQFNQKLRQSRRRELVARLVSRFVEIGPVQMAGERLETGKSPMQRCVKF